MRTLLKQRSIAFKLLVGTLGALSAYVIIIGFLAYMSARDSISDSYDQSLVVNANALLYLMQEEASESGLNKPLSFKISDEDLQGGDKDIFKEMSEYRMFRVWHNDKLILSSTEDLPASIKPFPRGFSDQVIVNDEWRVYTLYSPKKGIIVELGEQQSARTYLVLLIAKDLILPFALSLPVVAFMFWRAIRTGIADLLKVTRQVEARSPDQMTPLETKKLPPDLLPLVDAINALLTRLQESLSRERQITELAAHELRTPLTAIKLQAQLGLRAADETGRVSALTGLLTGVERAAHLVEQLLTLTRIEQSSFDLHEVDAAEAVTRVVSELRPLADKRSQRFSVQLHRDLIACANDDLLYITLTNVIGNAIKYAPDHSEIAVAGRRQGGSIYLDVTDHGPGIPEKVRERIFERFFRFNAGKVLGSGLGLTIAKQCADRMRASLSVHTPEVSTGLCVRLACMAATPSNS